MLTPLLRSCILRARRKNPTNMAWEKKKLDARRIFPEKEAVKLKTMTAQEIWNLPPAGWAHVQRALPPEHSLQNHDLFWQARIAPVKSITRHEKLRLLLFPENTRRVFDHNVAAHVLLALQYESISLPLLDAFFKTHGDDAVVRSYLAQEVERAPSGREWRRLAFFHNWLYGFHPDWAPKQLPPGTPVYAGLDPDTYVVLPDGHVDPRTKIRDNLPGTRLWCPIFRKSDVLEQALGGETDQLARLHDMARVPDEIMHRAAFWFLSGETKSTYDIEREPLSPTRAERFFKCLGDAGLVTDYTPSSLLRLHRNIVEHREGGIRQEQNFVGESSLYGEKVLYPCPPPALVGTLLAGWRDAVGKADNLSPTLQAAMASFGFVFIHPFMDGNGRLSRWFLHDVFARREVFPSGMHLPISSAIAANEDLYQEALNSVSVPLRQVAEYAFASDKKLEIQNTEEIETLYRFPDLTRAAEILFDFLHDLERIIPQEIELLRLYDAAAAALDEQFELPDADARIMLASRIPECRNVSKRAKKMLSRDTIEQIDAILEFLDLFINEHQEKRVEAHGFSMSM